MFSRGRHNRARGAVTLIELLVVISILAMLAMVAIPRMQPAMEERQIRESARALNVFLGSARARAMQTGRPVGVLFARNAIGTSACTLLSRVEIPPPYSGDVISAAVKVQPGGLGLKMQVQNAAMASGLIRRGDRIQLNHQGPLYTILDDLSDNTPDGDPSWPDGTDGPGDDFPCDAGGFIDFTQGNDTSNDGWIDDRWLSLWLDPTANAVIPWPSGEWSNPVAFSIYRQPAVGAGVLSQSAAKPLQLPQGMVVDLEFSGTDAGKFDKLDSYPVIVMFSPNGSLDRLYYQNGATRVTGPVYLLVGKLSRATDPTDPTFFGEEDRLRNWQDLKNLWVTVSPQTGMVTVAELYAESGNVDAAGITRPKTLRESRKLARQAQISKGGR